MTLVRIGNNDSKARTYGDVSHASLYYSITRDAIRAAVKAFSYDFVRLGGKIYVHCVGE